MKPTKTLISILVSSYRPGANDFAAPSYTVADYSSFDSKVTTEKLKHWTDQTAAYWEDKGYEVLQVLVTENRFAPYEVTMKHPRRPRLIEFKHRWEAEKYARDNFNVLWSAYQDSVAYEQKESAKRYLKSIGCLPKEIDQIMTQAKNLAGSELDNFIESFTELAF